MPIASLIIPTYNRQKIVLQTLDYLNHQVGKDFEIIVVDQTKLPQKQLKDFKPIYSSVNYKYINIEEIGLPNARNIGAEVSSAPILIYIDDDCIPDRDMVSSYVNIFNNLDSRTWCVAGRVIEKNNNIFRQSNKIVGGWITWYGKTLKNLILTIMGSQCSL
jgi:Glycosyltransferases involved in cell wall biogenesis